MATKDELFSTRFWKAENLKRPTTLEISECNTETLKNAEGVAKEKLVVYFTNEKKSLVCNLTNFDSIVEVTGQDDSDEWVGHKVCLFPTTTQLGNKRVACIRVKAPAAAVSATPKKAIPPKPAPSSDDGIEEMLDDDAPKLSDDELEQMRAEVEAHHPDDDVI